MFQTPTVLAPMLFERWRYRLWKIGRGGCDIHGVSAGVGGVSLDGGGVGVSTGGFIGACYFRIIS